MCNGRAFASDCINPMITTAHMYLSWGAWSLLQPRALLPNNTRTLFITLLQPCNSSTRHTTFYHCIQTSHQAKWVKALLLPLSVALEYTSEFSTNSSAVMVATQPRAFHLSTTRIQMSSQHFYVQISVATTQARSWLYLEGNTHNRSNFGYIAWVYEMVYAQREVLLEESLPVQPPEGWKSLANEMLSFGTSEDAWEASDHGKTGVFIIVCDQRRYEPPSVEQIIPV